VFLLNLARSVAHAYPVPELPVDNLIVNPWFRSASNRTEAGFDGWTRPLTDGVTWGLSHKESNPSPDIVVSGRCGAKEVYCGTAARWAAQSGIVYPDVDVFAYQVVATDPAQRKLNFFTHYVSHRVDVGAVNIYGGNSANGPWTLVWLPLYHSQDRQIVPESGEIQELWEETGFIERTLEQGYPFYKIELQARLPQSPGIRGVGFKLTGVYFSTEFTDEPGLPPPTPGPPLVTTPANDDGNGVTPTETGSLPATAVTSEAAPGTSAAPPDSGTPTAASVAEDTGNQGLATLAAEALSTTENIITWDTSENNGRGFRLERSSNGTAEWKSIAVVAPGTTEYIDSGLRPDTLYYYRLRLSQADTSNVVSAKTEPLAETALAAPASLRVVSDAPQQLTLTWEDVSSNETGFAVERSTDGLNFTTIKITGPNMTSFVDENLVPAIYFYRVRSFSGDTYSRYSGVASVTVRGESVESGAAEAEGQPGPSEDVAQSANSALTSQGWLITLAAITLFVVLVGVGLLVARTKRHPLE
jgi:hypothetical protein